MRWGGACLMVKGEYKKRKMQYKRDYRQVEVEKKNQVMIKKTRHIGKEREAQRNGGTKRKNINRKKYKKMLGNYTNDTQEEKGRYRETGVTKKRKK